MDRERRIIILSLTAFVLFSAVVPLVVMADPDEEWFDGPGEVNTDDRNGLDRDVYLQLWNLDEDRNLSEPIYDADEDGENSWKDMANLAAEIDFSSYDYPENNAIQRWNQEAKNDFETELENTESITYVPPSRINDLKSSNRIKDAYIAIYSIDPSLNMIDENASLRNGNYTSVRSDGKVVTAVDYRVDEPQGIETSDRRVEYEKEKDPTIEYHKLSYYPNCSEGDGCVMDKNKGDGHVSTLEFNNLDRREHTLYVESQVEAKWKKTVSVCQDDFGPVNPPGGDNTTDGNTTENGNETTEQIGNSIQKGAFHSVSQPSTAQCENWIVVSERVITDTVTFDKEFDVKVEGEIFGRVQYAEFPDSYQVKINFGKRWTHAELPGGTRVESGWRIFASRNPTYTYLEGIYSGTHDRYLETNDPPVQANMYPDKNGISAYNEGEDDDIYTSPKIIYTDGERAKIPTLPENALYETPEDQFPETEQKEFIDIDEVIVEINKEDFNPNGKVTLHGVMKNSEETLGDDVRQVKKPNLTVKINKFYKENSTAKLTIILVGPEGEPINTQNREGYLKIQNKTLDTKSNGKVTTLVEMNSSLRKPKVEYIPEDWWRMDENTQAYTRAETRFSPSKGHSLWGAFSWIFTRGLVLWAIFVVIRKGILKSTGIDIQEPLFYAYEEFKEAIFSVFDLITGN
jgi:hypothetical protein